MESLDLRKLGTSAVILPSDGTRIVKKLPLTKIMTSSSTLMTINQDHVMKNKNKLRGNGEQCQIKKDSQLHLLEKDKKTRRSEGEEKY